jgi:hypothetical protein
LSGLLAVPAALLGEEAEALDQLGALAEGLEAEASTGAEAGIVTLYLEPPALAYYYYAFYDLAYFSRNLGMFMMTWAVAHFASRGFDFLYLGSCYQPNALYKTQFSGAEFFNGLRWSADLEELKYLMRRGESEPVRHLLEVEEYRRLFYEDELPELASASPFGTAREVKP